ALSDASNRYYSLSEDLAAFEAELGILMGNETKLEDDIHEAVEKRFALLKKKKRNHLIDDLTKIEADVASAASKKAGMMEAWANMRSFSNHL
ncbi:hypothetical protein A2U01_0023612, partial [Trifolium medium]|nr:hypothetical protein [Trifolium medium]